MENLCKYGKDPLTETFFEVSLKIGRIKLSVSAPESEINQIQEAFNNLNKIQASENNAIEFFFDLADKLKKV